LLFDDFFLRPELLRAIDKMGFDAPNAAQREAIPPALEGRDVMLSAETGGGKTLAFLIPLVQRLLETPPEDGRIGAVVLAPTRELVVQIDKVFRRLAGSTGLSSARVTGGIRHKSQLEWLAKQPELIVATPGRLLELLATGETDIGTVRTVVLDEADRMFELGLREAVEGILSAAPTDRQLLLYSATAADSRCGHFAVYWLKNPVILTLDSPRRLPASIAQSVLFADTREHKLALLEQLLRAEKGRKLVFVNTREHLVWLIGALSANGSKVLVLHGELRQPERDRCLREFHAGSRSILLATDVAARGLHIDDVKAIINWDMPRKGDLYVHRAGRTGRDGKPGRVFNLVEAHDLRYLERIQRYLCDSLPVTTIEGLEPRHRLPVARRKKRKADKEKPKPRSKPKQRLRERKNKGKPKGPLGRKSKTGEAAVEKVKPSRNPWKQSS